MLAQENPNRDPAEAARATFLFADLCGFTQYTCRYGDELAADLAVDFHRRVCRLAADEDCSVVKSIGDAVMVHSKDSRTAVRLARRILALSRLDGYPPIRIGIDCGPAVRRGGGLVRLDRERRGARRRPSHARRAADDRARARRRRERRRDGPSGAAGAEGPARRSRTCCHRRIEEVTIN